MTLNKSRHLMWHNHEICQEDKTKTALSEPLE